MALPPVNASANSAAQSGPITVNYDGSVNTGGGFKMPGWGWAVLAAVVALFLWKRR